MDHGMPWILPGVKRMAIHCLDILTEKICFLIKNAKTGQILMQFNVELIKNHIDFYTNICYSMGNIFFIGAAYVSKNHALFRNVERK